MSQKDKDKEKDKGGDTKPPVDPLPAVASNDTVTLPIDANDEANKKFEHVRAAIDEQRGKFAIKTPNPGFRGERAGVKFNDGVGYTDDKKKADALAGLGYEVVKL